MAKKTSTTKPLLLIVIAIAAAGGIALYLSRQGSTAEAESKTSTPGAATTVPVAAAGGGGRVRGAADAKVTLLEYGDFQCPTCGHYHPILTELLKRYEGQLKLEFHHFPLIQIHPNAMGASLAAEAAGDQGKFWEMSDLLYEHQNDWAPNPNADAMFLQYALQLGLDSTKFTQASKSAATRDRVLADVSRGNDIVKGTPTFVLNGQVLPDLPDLKGFSELIDRLLTPASK